jgi:nucleoid-associated protein Lsr2
VKISIDSTEPLEHVLRVLGAAYNVTLAVAPAEGTDDGSTKPRRRTSRAGDGSRAPRNRANGRGGTVKDRAAVGNAELRSWARANGHTVSDRGRVPAAVVAAYRSAH